MRRVRKFERKINLLSNCKGIHAMAVLARGGGDGVPYQVSHWSRPSASSFERKASAASSSS